MAGEHIIKTSREQVEIFNMLDEGIIVVDSQDTIIYANSRAQKLLGYKRNELLGQDAHKLIHYKNSNGEFVPKENCQNLKKVFQEKETIRIEDYFVRNDGILFPVRLSFTPVINHSRANKSNENDFQRAIIVFEDITRQKKIINDLKEEELMVITEKERLKLAQSVANIGAFEINLDNGIITWTEEQEKLYGLKQGEFKGGYKDFLEMVHPEDREKLQVISQNVKQKKGPSQFKFRIILPNGNIRWILAISKTFRDKTGSPKKIIGVNMDITRQIKTEESLKFLSEAGRVLSSSLDLRATLTAVTKLSASVLSDWCFINIENENGELELLALSHKDPKKTKWAESVIKSVIPHLSEKMGLLKVMKTGKREIYPLITDEIIKKSIKSQKEIELIKAIGISSVMIFPLLIQKKAIGGITFVLAGSDKSFSVSEVHIAEQLADRAALAIENARLYKKVWEQNQKLNTVVDNVPGIVSESRGEPGTKDYKVSFVSSFAKKMLGYSKKEWFSTDDFWNKITHPDDREKGTNNSRDFYKTGKNGKKIFRLITKTGQTKWVESHSVVINDDKGHPVGLRGVTMDITERIQSERKARELASIVENSDDAIIGQKLDGTVTSWNLGAERIYGYSAAEMMNKKILAIIPPDKREEFDEIMEVIGMGESIDHLETSRLTKDGRVLDVSLTVSPMRDESGKIVGASGIGRDISIQKELERRKDAFIGMASHELKTPITSIKAFIQVLQQRFKNTEDPLASRFLGKTEEQLNRLSDLVSDLLDLSKIQAGKLELKKQNLNLNQIIHDTIEEVQATTLKHVITSSGIIKKEVYGDRDRLSQVLINLLTNAIKYSPNADKVVVQLEENDNKVTVMVKDYGIGISKSQQKRIFDRFYRAEGTSEKTFPGLGIGLYISSEIIRRHGGTIWVESSKKSGSTFGFTLPYK